MNRYEVTSTVTRRHIIYAENSEGAQAKVERHVRDQGAVAKFHIDEVKQLPPIEAEAKGPEVDGAPPRETRS